METRNGNKKGARMTNTSYNSSSTSRRGYKDQLIYYYNRGVGNKSEIAGVKITKKLINTIEKRYRQLGGILPISREDINREKGKSWTLV